MRSESLDPNFRNCDNTDDFRGILNFPFVNGGYCGEEYFVGGEE